MDVPKRKKLSRCKPKGQPTRKDESPEPDAYRMPRLTQGAKGEGMQLEQADDEQTCKAEREEELPDVRIGNEEPDCRESQQNRIADELEGKQLWTHASERGSEQAHLVASFTSRCNASEVAWTPGWYIGVTRAGLISKLPGLVTLSK